ncbi:sensor histidine kinase [Flavobacterium piscisymbiosum]|uniref:histidine kinase n=1 Tax=Flavobacterium piscisymbiosum TaxID=2893753 RepID=A0ABS8MH11_9FLAO|nr:HAMP domain-containing sensor histidine kinase [Flavobacterium sp. F-30]MCC9064772.1 HAMP domain-containing histidine kinase [Flavobacterium sp. F-30]
MKRKIMLLIGACIFTVIALTSIQGYFIYNTYQLNEKEINTAIKKQIARLEDTEEWENLNNTWAARSKEYSKQYLKGDVTKQNFIQYLSSNKDSLSAAMNTYMKKMAEPEDYDIDYSIYLNSIIVINNKKTDTLFKGKALILANDTLKKNQILSSIGRWEIQDSDTELSMIVKSERYYGFDKLQQTIISKMAGLLLFSVVLMVFVVFLYYMSLKNLITQKRIADIKTDFVNNITHEFQTPLATMDIAIKTLQRKDKQMSPEHYTNTLSMIARQNERLQKLFRQVTEASVMPIANKDIIQVTDEEIKDMIDDFKLSKPNAVIEFSCQKEAFSIPMDRFHFNTILINLLDNAVKYGADKIETDLKITDKSIILSVKDNGKGISTQEQVSIFDKFYRVEKGNIHNSKGLGLGLFYIKQLVETYSGNIRVVSAEAKGSLFIITIPV